MISNTNIRINSELCYACGICVDRCIMDNLSLSTAPCRQECPLNLNCQGYVRLMAQGKEEEAARELRKYTPFGAILGRVCSRPCEAACERDRRFKDGAVHIRALKRYLADSYPDIALGSPVDTKPDSGRRAAVIGSGPAGLMAAYRLRADGHRVDLFEAEAEPGGFLRHAIPSFRLPVEVVDRTIGFLESIGIVFKTSQAVGQQVGFDELKAYDAVVAAIGTGAGKGLDISADNMEGVVSALDLLSETKKGRPPRIGGKSIVVIGGGNTAVDSALVCLMSGAAEVKIVCLENPHQMPAYPQELREAQEAGITVENCWGVSAMSHTTEGRIILSLARCVSVFDAEGNFNPELDAACTLHELTADVVVAAIGQQVDSKGLPGDLFDAVTGLLPAHHLTLRANTRNNLFVCGDCFTGPTSVVHAMASGREAAISADRFLRGESLGYGRDQYTNNSWVRFYDATTRPRTGGPRGTIDRLAVNQRNLDSETDRLLTREQARQEAERCLSCGRSFEANRTCWYCLPCEIECPVDALEVRMPYQVR